MKKKIFVFLFFILGFNFIGAQVFEKGLDIADKLFARAESSEFIEIFLPEYTSTYSYYDSIKDKLTKSDFVSCYEIIWNFDELMKIFVQQTVLKSSDVLSDYFNQAQLFSLYTSMLNSRYGENVNALSAILNCTSLFDATDLIENKNYVYIFEESYAVAVSFRKGEDNAVLANAVFLFTDELINGSEKDIKKVLNYPFGDINIIKVK